MHVQPILCSFEIENAKNRSLKLFFTYTTYKFIFIQFYIYFSNLTFLVKGNWGCGKSGGVSVLVR